MSELSRWTEPELSRYVRLLRKDLIGFCKENDKQKILLLPPSLSRSHRFCFHNFIEEEFGTRLSSFSVGEEPERRMVIAHKIPPVPRNPKEMEQVPRSSAQSEKKHRTQEKYVPPALRRKQPVEKLPEAASSHQGSERKVQEAPALKMCDSSHLLFLVKAKPPSKLSSHIENELKTQTSQPIKLVKTVKKKRKKESSESATKQPSGKSEVKKATECCSVEGENFQCHQKTSSDKETHSKIGLETSDSQYIVPTYIESQVELCVSAQENIIQVIDNSESASFREMASSEVSSPLDFKILNPSEECNINEKVVQENCGANIDQSSFDCRQLVQEVLACEKEDVQASAEESDMTCCEDSGLDIGSDTVMETLSPNLEETAQKRTEVNEVSEIKPNSVCKDESSITAKVLKVESLEHENKGSLFEESECSAEGDEKSFTCEEVQTLATNLSPDQVPDKDPVEVMREIQTKCDDCSDAPLAEVNCYTSANETMANPVKIEEELDKSAVAEEMQSGVVLKTVEDSLKPKSTKADGTPKKVKVKKKDGTEKVKRISDQSSPKGTSREGTSRESNQELHGGTRVHKNSSALSPMEPDQDIHDWELLYDNDGLLDSSLVNEIQKTVGEDVKVGHCSQFENALHEDDLETDSTIEIFNIPSGFNTNDLLGIFLPYVPKGFFVKWVDDTHALGIFSSASAAREVLERSIPPVKTRSLRYAIPQSREKARHVRIPSTFRPRTCQVLARRLISGALGIRVAPSKEQREAESRVLREARDEKRLAAKQKQAAWEGSF